MGSVPAELSLEFRPTFVPKTISDFLKEVSMIGNVKERVSKIDDFVKCLEEEMRKIEAFKRELPLCMLLLNDATIALKKETVQCAAQKNEPVLEEFIPLKKNCDENEEKDHRDKKNWMSCVQLWTSDSDHPNNPKQNSKVESKRNAEEIRFVTEDAFQSSKTRPGGSANMPFKPVFPRPVVARKESKEGLLHGLSLLTPGMKNLKEESGSSGSKTSCSRSVSSAAANVNSLRSGSQQQTPRKQRRCWSPELHRRFVSALSQLGGSQAATPKQIRELMQVDGLTNDEVKSHLQKYRLHTRRLPAAPANPSVCVWGGVLGGLWMPQDQYDDSSKGSGSQSGSPQGPFHLGGTGGGTSTTGGDSVDDDEEESESYCWKNNAHKSGKDDV